MYDDFVFTGGESFHLQVDLADGYFTRVIQPQQGTTLAQVRAAISAREYQLNDPATGDGYLVLRGTVDGREVDCLVATFDAPDFGDACMEGEINHDETEKSIVLALTESLAENLDQGWVVPAAKA